MSLMLGAFDPEVEKTPPRLLSLAVDDKTRHACRNDLLAPGCRLVAADGEDFLFAIPPVLREEYEQYRVFVRGQLLEVRRLGFLSLEFSMVDFPPALVAYRTDIELRFAALWRTTDDCLYVCGPWGALTEEQRTQMACRFVNDNVRYFDL